MLDPMTTETAEMFMQQRDDALDAIREAVGHLDEGENDQAYAVLKRAVPDA